MIEKIIHMMGLINQIGCWMIGGHKGEWPHYRCKYCGKKYKER